MIWYLAMNCDDDEYCPVGALIFFAALAPIAALVMYINSLCLRPGFNQIHTVCNIQTKTVYIKRYCNLQFVSRNLEKPIKDESLSSIQIQPNMSAVPVA